MSGANGAVTAGGGMTGIVAASFDAVPEFPDSADTGSCNSGFFSQPNIFSKKVLTNPPVFNRHQTEVE
jgi:hypothetical protein